MSNKLDVFEKAVKDAVEGVEISYNSKAWYGLSHKLDELSGGSVTTQTSFVTGLVAGLVTIGAWLAIMHGVQQPVSPSATLDELPAVVQSERLNETALDAMETPDAVEHPVKITSEKQSKASDVVVKRITEEKKLGELSNTGEETDKMNSSFSVSTEDYSIRVESPKTQLCLGESPHLIITTKGLFDEEQILVNGKVTDEPIRFEQPGIYEIIPQGIVGKRAVSGEPLLLEVLKQPFVKVNTFLSKDAYGRQAIAFSIEDRSEIEEVNWFRNDKLVSTADSYTMIATQADLYQVNGIVTDANGCTDTTRTGASVSEPYNLLAPTAFTPNGDGRNDSWMPEALVGIDLPFTLVIFDNKGRPVFETTDPYAVWKGKVAGEPVIPGSVYVWKSTVEFPEGTQNFTGSITVVE